MTEFSRYQQAVALLTAARRPLFVLLADVDADALGSALALVRSLERGAHGVRPTIFCPSAVPSHLAFLLDPRHSVEHNLAALDWASFDLAVVTDAGSLGRTGLEAELRAFVAEGRPLLNVDHHHAHEPFGTVNLIDEHASATAELVYDVVKLGGWVVDADVATAVLAGLVADTGNFSNAATTVRSLTIAAECYAKGADVRGVVRELFRSKPLGALQFWGTVLSRLQRHDRWGIITTVILKDDFQRYGVSDEAADGISNFMNSIADVNAALVLTELPNGEVRGSLRTTRENVDVSKLAAALGGGGHRKAAGFRIPGRIVSTPQGWRLE